MRWPWLTPLTGQDIRLSYYSQSPCVRFVQSVGIFDSSRPGSKRMINALDYPWPWVTTTDGGGQWKSWWEDTKGASGQTASEMFLWYLIGKHRDKLDALLADNQAITKLKIRFRGNTDEVLDIFCAQFKQEDLSPDDPRLFPDLEELRTTAFPQFAEWWYNIRMECGPSANVAKHRSIGLLIPSLCKVFGNKYPSEVQWGYISRFLKSSRDTARDVLKVYFPEPKGKWTSQHRQLTAYDDVVEEIATR